jgi:hypothetical protein
MTSKVHRMRIPLNELCKWADRDWNLRNTAKFENSIFRILQTKVYKKGIAMQNMTCKTKRKKFE